MKFELKKTSYMATISNGGSHLERRVYTDDMGNRFVTINRCLFDIDMDLDHCEVKVWYAK